MEWLETKSRLEQAQAAWQDPATPSRVLLICGSARNDGTCPGEISKSFRMAQWAQETLAQAPMQAEVRNVASAVANAVSALRAGTLSQPDKHLSRPRPK